MKRLTFAGVLGISSTMLWLTGACGGGAFSGTSSASGAAGVAVAGDGSIGSAGSIGAAGSGHSGGSIGSAGSVGAGGTTSIGGSVSSGGSTSTGGSTSSGGSISSGGSVSSGGSAGAAGTGGSSGCGTVTFEMVPANSTTAGAFCDSCAPAWLTITDPNSKVVAVQKACNATLCSTCSLGVCPPVVACVDQVLPAQGVTWQWDATEWVSGTCGSGTSCSKTTCAASGKYQAKMCAIKNSTANTTTCTPTSTQTCSVVDFTLPSADPVVATITGG